MIKKVIRHFPAVREIKSERDYVFVSIWKLSGSSFYVK